ncbi:hypothetical protein [Streptomyces sp. WM6378]|uniref:hypothetical protein n=1 Tax=Streptomyces sp. WM6378 TaxID=1415557 RepID=UPI0006AF7838|nr:hypothetical protein [Streptomyces sp. WM6378]KOU34899.1 hypothetical protein ADK54_39790 [Streptomyces sp. WM6378]
MSDDLPEPTGLPWHWEWVPDVRPGEAEHEAWTAHMVSLFTDWTFQGMAAARPAWPGDAEVEFPFTSDMVGRGAAEWLLARAKDLPPYARVAWGAAFVNGTVRWAPVPVIVEFRHPQAEDPTYLMKVVDAAGRDDDARLPTVDYVTTPIGDGVQIFALGRTEEGTAFGRLDAAMRLDVPPRGGAASVSTDVTLNARVFELGLMALIGTGVEQLMQQIANDCAPADGGSARLGFVAAAEGGQP